MYELDLKHLDILKGMIKISPFSLVDVSDEDVALCISSCAAGFPLQTNSTITVQQTLASSLQCTFGKKEKKKRVSCSM